MTDTKQPEALEIADLLESFANAVGEHPSGSRARAAAELRRQQTEIDRLTKHLHGANSQAEEFERKWYLRGDEVEAKDARIAELEAENRALKDQLEAISAGGVTGLRVAPLLDRSAFERQAVKDKADRDMECEDGYYTSPWLQAAWRGFEYAAAIAQEGGK